MVSNGDLASGKFPWHTKRRLGLTAILTVLIADSSEGVFQGSSTLLLGRIQADVDGALSIQMQVGDVLVLPAGTGHSSLESSADYRYIGVYPKVSPCTSSSWLFWHITNLCDVCSLLQSFPPLFCLLRPKVASYFLAEFSIFLLSFEWKLLRVYRWMIALADGKTRAVHAGRMSTGTTQQRCSGKLFRRWRCPKKIQCMERMVPCLGCGNQEQWQNCEGAPDSVFTGGSY